jgi:hypothetical protein
MFDLNLVHVHQADRERSVVADLRRRQILGTPDDAIVPARRPVVSTSTPSRMRVRVGVAER